MKRKWEIIQTLPYLETNDIVMEFVHKCIQLNVTTFRFNLAKITTKYEFEILSEKLNILKNRYPGSKIILDFPYPYKKIRLFHRQKNIHVTKGTLLEFNSNNTNQIEGYINVEDLSQYFTLNKKYLYNEGIGEFCVQEISKNRIVFCALGDFDLFSSKNIMSDRLIYDNTCVQTYLDLINKYKIDQIWFSFVDNLKMIDCFMKQVEYKSNVFLKIESQAGVNQLSELLLGDYNIMVARGDLAMNIEWKEFLKVQEMIVNLTKKAGKMVYVGTDVLSSMRSRMIPVRAELIDLLLLKQYQIHGIMLNVDLLYGNYYNKVIDYIYE